MRGIKKILWDLLHPHAAVTIFLTAGSAAGLYYIFRNHYEEEWFSYVIYTISFYALCAAIVSTVPAIKRTKKAICKNRYVSLYLGEMELRMRLALYRGLVINLGYGIFQMVIAVIYDSVWFGALAVYYAALSIIRSFLIARDWRTGRIGDERERLLQQWQSHRICGGLLLALNVTISGIAAQMIWNNEGYSYPGLVIYASATYTFYRLTVAIVRICKRQRGINPVLSASKALDLSVALMAILALQTAMFHSFGTESGEEFQKLMNIITGGAVCVIVICLALYMIVQSTILLMQEKDFS